MKRIVSVILALIMLMSCVLLYGCGGEQYQPVISYGTKSISTNMFTYILSQAKTLALYTLGQTSDSAEFWDTDTGVLMAEYIMNDAVDTAMSVVYYASVAEAGGITLSKEELEEIKTNLETLITNYGTDKSGFNGIMANYGVNYDILSEYYALQKMAEKGKDLVLGENGTHPITEEDYLEYYNENYVTLRHLNLNNVNKLGANGKEVILTDEEKAAVEAQAAEIEAGLAAGQDLSEFAGMSSDMFLASYPRGFTIPTTNELYTLSYAAEQEGTFNVFGLYYYLLNNVEGFADTAFMGTVGEVKRMDTEKGIFFLQRMPLDMEMYELYKEIMKESGSLEPSKTRELMDELEAEFTVDQATLDTFTVKGANMIALQ